MSERLVIDAASGKAELVVHTAEEEAAFRAAQPTRRTDERRIAEWLAENPFTGALIRALNKPPSDPAHLPPNAALTNADLIAKIKANLR